MNHAGDLGHAAQAGQRTGNHHHQHRVARDIDARIAGRPRVVADQPDLVSPAAAIDHDPKNDRRHDAQQQAQVRGQSRKERARSWRSPAAWAARRSWGMWGVIWNPPSVHTAKIQKLTQATAM